MIVRVIWVKLFSVLGAGLVTLGGMVVVLMARTLLRPPRMTAGKALVFLHRLSPLDLGLTYEDVNFEVRDASTGKPLRIAGWWMECGQSRKTVMILHGWTDAKIGGIAWAPMFNSMGFNVLAIDLRAHGESGGEHCTAGFFERDDVSQVIDQIRLLRPDRTRELVLFGVSLGAAVALATAAMRDDIDAIIVDSPFADFRRAAMAQADLMGMPMRLLPALAFELAKKMSGANPDEVRPIDTLLKTRAPILAILLHNEALNDEIAAKELDEALAARSERGLVTQVWRIDAPHALGLTENSAEYSRKIGDFLARIENPCHGEADSQPA